MLALMVALEKRRCLIKSLNFALESSEVLVEFALLGIDILEVPVDLVLNAAGFFDFGIEGSNAVAVREHHVVIVTDLFGLRVKLPNEVVEFGRPPAEKVLERLVGDGGGRR